MDGRAQTMPLISLHLRWLPPTSCIPFHVQDTFESQPGTPGNATGHLFP